MTKQSSIRVVGWTLSRILPGVFWSNLFRPPYRHFIGHDWLRLIPASPIAKADAGVPVRLGLAPCRWNTVEYATVEQQARDHLGSQLLSTKAEPDWLTVMPWSAK